MSSEISQKEVAQVGGKTAFKDYIGKFADVEDPYERRRLALEEIDKSGFGWTQVKMILIAGVGFLTDAYDIFSINLGTTMLAVAFYNGTIPDSSQTLIKVSTSVGTVVGQFGFGIIADVFGRKKIYGSELVIIITTCILQCTLAESSAINFTAIFTFFRIVMGIGIGGDYPLSSIVSSEFSTTKWRGAIMAAVFSNQGLGQIAAGIVAMILVAGYKGDLERAKSGSDCVGDCKKACDQMWRVLIGFGAVPGCIALYFRLTISESPRYTLDVNDEGNLEKVGGNDDDVVDVETAKINPPKAGFKDFWRHFGKWKYGKILIGTAGSWFMLDIAYYGLGLNTAVILDAIGYSDSNANNLYEKFYNTAAGNLILVCAGSLPGYWFSAALIDIVGRKPIQIGGFIILTALFCGIGFGNSKLSSGGLLGLYVVAQFFQNFGPNVTTFVVPGESFPTRYRSSAHGISAACGKVGAIIAQTVLGKLVNHTCPASDPSCGKWLPHVIEIFALFMLLGIFTSLLIPETRRKTLEEISEQYHGEMDPSKLIREKLNENKAYDEKSDNKV